MKLKYTLTRVVEVSDWDAFVEHHYGRKYALQQQDGCWQRGTRTLIVPSPDAEDDEAESIPIEVNGDEMGVKFEVWKNCDVKAASGELETYEIDLFWHRNFYPMLEMVGNDLHAQGKLEAGEYLINIDW